MPRNESWRSSAFPPAPQQHPITTATAPGLCGPAASPAMRPMVSAVILTMEASGLGAHPGYASSCSTSAPHSLPMRWMLERTWKQGG